MKALKFFLLLLLPACAYKVEKEPLPTGGGFTEIRALVLGPKCLRCHGEALATYAAVLPLLDEIAARIQSSDPNLMMPPPGSSLSAAERTLLLDWIARGAPEGPGGVAPAPPPPGLSGFALLQAKVFPKCSRCHGGGWLSSYESTFGQKDEIARRVQLTDFEQMPPANRPQLSEEEKQLLLTWIALGAPREGGIQEREL